MADLQAIWDAAAASSSRIKDAEKRIKALEKRVEKLELKAAKAKVVKKKK
jgi:hypothetical protein